jgi:flavin-dependent dehydrogenase
VTAADAGVVVAGGGPAGAAAACHLARAGRAVTVIERDAAPAHRVCGEFLGGDALAELALLGIDVPALGGVAIDRLRLVRGARMVEAALPFAAAGVSRQVLDAALLQAAARAGAVVRRGETVGAVSAREVRTEQRALPAAAVLLATGKHELRGWRRAHPRPDWVGFKTHAVLAPLQAAALAGAVELMLFADAYVGLQMVDAGTANLCLLADAARLRRDGGWDGLLAGLRAACRHLDARLSGAALWPRPLAIAGVPYGFLHRATEDAVFRLGDQMGVIASFTGDGMAIALRTGRLAADCVAAGLGPAEYHRRAAATLRRPLRVAGALYDAGRVPIVQAAMVQAARLWPGCLAAAGRMTRLAAS